MRCHARYVLVSLLFALHIQTAISIPQSLFRRQDLLSGLQLPQCALTCFVAGLLTDGCANETDFACHCRDGNIMEKAAACVKQGCGTKDGSDAMRKVGTACSSVGGGGGGGGVDESRNGDRSSSAVNPRSTAISSPSLPTSGPAPSQQPSSNPNNDNNNSQSSSMSTLSPSSFPSSTASISPTVSSTLPPTDMPLAPLPPSDQLSAGAKAGIAVSVSLIALSIFFALGWYIRRLKRDLAAAQALVTSTSEPPWPPGETIFSPATGTFARTESSRGRRSPVSPLSSPPMIISDNGYGVLKKKRGNVLSIVVEDDEDRSSLVPSRGGAGVIREPVPGQREGLVDPLELDGVWTGLVEAPLAVTPRERSRERER